MKTKLIILLHASCILLLTSYVYAFVAAPTEDVKNTRHNLSSSGPAGRTVTTAQTTEICVFCHTPHGANPDVATLMGAPIWNRRVLATGYQLYDQVWSKSFEGTLDPSKQPTGFSRLCLSCHDGTIALGRVINPPGSGGFVPRQAAGESSPTGVPIITDPILKTFDMTYSAGPPLQDPTLETPARPAGSMPTGGGVMTGSTATGILSGDTRMLGTELRNDHPISFLFNQALSNRNKDDELQGLTMDTIPLPLTKIGATGTDPDLTPLKRHVGSNSTTADSVQCTSCHNPHQVDYPKFLRAERVQRDFSKNDGTGPFLAANTTDTGLGYPPTTRPAAGALPNTAIICVFCHDKPGVPYGSAAKNCPPGSSTSCVTDYNSVPVSYLGYTDTIPTGLSTHFTDPTLLKSGATDLASTTADQLASFINNPTATQVSVRQRACLACHDPHTEQGSIRLLRSGASNAVADTPTPSEPDKAVAIEQTCYMCHSPTTVAFNTMNIIGDSACSPTWNGVSTDCPPDVLTQFRKDTGTPTAPAGADPAFTIPEFSLTQAYPAGPPTENVAGVNGSAMNLRLGSGHQPVFTNLPREGVQLGDENPQAGAPGFVPPLTFGGSPTYNPPSSGNKIQPENAPNVNDTRHIECVDCHNMHRVRRDNRFKGMPGITIDLNGDGTSTLLVAQTLNTVSATGCFNPLIGADPCRREPYIFEVCLRCHGNSFNQHVAEQRVDPANGTGLKVQLRGNNPVPSFPLAGYTPTLTSSALGGGSNKRKEFDPNAKPFYNSLPYSPCLNANTVKLVNQTPLNNDCGPGLTDTSAPNNGLPGSNTSFHPVARIGRNQSGVLDAYPAGQLLGGLSRASTIQCTDCHNTNLLGTFGGGVSFIKTGITSRPDFPGPVTFDGTRGLPWMRTTDLALPRVWSAAPYSTNSLNSLTILNDPTKPQGPHGSIWRRILRSNYDTLLATNWTVTTTDDAYTTQNFALCFNCHAEEAFTTPTFSAANRLTNFYRAGVGGGETGNLHYVHLLGRAKARCHECHYNVHSNIESGNTLYVNLPGLEDLFNGVSKNPGHASSTHLINFAPEVAPWQYNNPVWGNGPDINNGIAPSTLNDNKYKGPGCNLRCHNFEMQHNYDAHDVINGGKCNEIALSSGVNNCEQ